MLGSREILIELLDKHKQYYGESTKELRGKKGVKFRLQKEKNGKQWKLEVIKINVKGRRSYYVVKLDEGRELWKNKIATINE